MVVLEENKVVLVGVEEIMGVGSELAMGAG